jgi:hypothetical protein
MAITQFVLIFHVPAILTLSRLCASQHQLTLLFFVFSVVQGTWIATNILYVDTMQGRMIAAIVESCGQV